MLANFFGKSKPINFIIIIVLFFSYFSIATFAGLTWADFSGSFVLKTAALSFFFLIVFFFFNFITSKNNLTFDNSYAFLLFILFISFFLKEFLDIKMLTLFLLQLLFLRKMYSLKSAKTVFKKLFDAGFWLGILFILEPFSIVYLMLLFGAVYLYHKITIRTLLIPIVGFIVPLILHFTYSFWYDKTEEFQQLFYFLTDYDLSIYFQSQFLVPLILIGFFTIISLFLKTPKALSINNTFKRSWILVIFNLLISICFIVLLPERNGSEIMFILLPIAIIVANGLEIISKSVIKDVVLILLILCSFLFPFII